MDELLNVVRGCLAVHLGDLVHALEQVQVARLLRACLDEDLGHHIVKVFLIHLGYAHFVTA